jgi:selenide,water dikinase
MGGRVAMALNILGVPHDLDPDVVADILRGGADKVAEAGGVIVGGHTVIDQEPKYGLCAIGFVHPDRIMTKAGARPGDRVFLTKPLGTGLITTAAKFEECEPEHLNAATESMMRLNRTASEIATGIGATAMTDVTGFSLLGHAHEMAEAGGVRVCLFASKLPLLPGATEYAYRGVVTGGGQRNRSYLNGRVTIEQGLSEDFRHILYDPQTSGGLLFTLPEPVATEAEDRFAAAGEPLWHVGEIVAGSGLAVVA